MRPILDNEIAYLTRGGVAKWIGKRLAEMFVMACVVAAGAYVVFMVCR